MNSNFLGYYSSYIDTQFPQQCELLGPFDPYFFLKMIFLVEKKYSLTANISLQHRFVFSPCKLLLWKLFSFQNYSIPLLTSNNKAWILKLFKPNITVFFFGKHANWYLKVIFARTPCKRTFWWVNKFINF